LKGAERVGITLAWLLHGVACAPSQSFRPARLVGEDAHEVGIALSNIEARPYVVEPTQRVGQGWWATPLNEHWSLAIAAAFDASAVVGGAGLRFSIARSRRVALAVELELGLFYAGVSIPAALGLWPGGALYCSPRLGNWGPDVTPFLPCGLAVEIIDGFSVRAEGQLSWAEFQYYNRRAHWGFAVAHHW
jgi:hypothetical protein